MKYLHDVNRWGVNEAPSLIEKALVKIFRVRVIFKEAGLYLRRFYLTPRWRWLPFKVFLHHIKISDDARACHDHPWAFITRMLKGIYTEYIQANSFRDSNLVENPILIRRVVKAGDTIRNSINHIHRVQVDEDVWTLVIVGKAKRMWGFHVPHVGFIPWREYLKTPDALDYPEDVF